MDSRALRRTRGAALALAVLLAAGACSGDDGDEKGGPDDASPSGPDEIAEVPLEARAGRLTGKLGPAKVEKVVDAVAAVTQGWFDAAYLAGDYPRSDFQDAYPGFTAAAAKQARKQAGLLTNAAIGADVEEVTAVKEKVVVDVFSPKRKPAGATARFTLVFDTSGAHARRVRVRGRLVLTPTGSGWKVFAYDVRRSEGAPTGSTEGSAE